MTKSVLDTDIFSEVLRGRDATVARRAADYRLEHGRLTITTVTVTEIVTGFARAQREGLVSRFVGELDRMDILPLDRESAVLAGRIDAALHDTGQPVAWQTR